MKPARLITEKEKNRYIKRKLLNKRCTRFCMSVFLGWYEVLKHTKKLSLFIWMNMVWYSFRYAMPCKIYLKEKLYSMSSIQREEKAKDFLRALKGKYERWSKRWNWYKEYVRDRKFQVRYTTKRWEKSKRLREKRRLAYKQRYNMGEDCRVQYDVDLNREHFLEGSIKTGDHVLFSKHVFIDYSGEVIIDDHAKLANGVIIETHYRDMEAYDKGKDVNIPTKLHICENAYIGSRAMILSSCHYIGKHARVGAGAVVTKDVPDYATVVGVPAKVVKVNAPTIPTETN